MPMNCRQVVEDFRNHPDEAERAFRGAIREDRSLVDGFDLGRLFEECFGWEEFRHCREKRDRSVHKVFENAGPTTTAAFVNISGQIIYNEFMQVYEAEDYVFKNMIPTTQTEFNGEKIPGVSALGDDGDEVAESRPYPVAGVTEDYIESPETTKRGLITAITREAVFFNRTGSLLMDRISDVARSVAVKQEKEAVDAFIDANRTKHRHKWRGTTYSSYLASGDSGPWINKVASTPLADWASVNTVELLLSKIVDPNTGLPIMISPTEIVVAHDLLHTARQIVSATEIRTAVGGYATSGNLSMRVSPNSVQTYGIVSSRMLGSRMDTASISRSNWWLANIKEQLRYMQNWPMEVTTAPAGSEAEFTQDIVMRWRCSRRGEYFVKQPRTSAYATA